MMSRFKTAPQRGATVQAELAPVLRSPQRVSITLNWALHQRLLRRSDWEGRSLSNLAAHLLEQACPAGPD
jgi:hypothetical protein